MRLDLNLLRQKHIPLHLAVNVGEFDELSEEISSSLLQDMLKIGFPILSVNLKPKDSDQLLNFLDKVINSNIFEEQVRVFVIGDWYNLDHKIVEKAKFLIDKTKDYDKHFLNILINYDGKQELLNSIKLISKKISLGQLNAEDIKEETIKENIFNSYFTPPELIVETAENYSGLMLWDSIGSKIFYTKKNKNMFKEALAFFQA